MHVQAQHGQFVHGILLLIALPIPLFRKLDSLTGQPLFLDLPSCNTVHFGIAANIQLQ